MEEIWKDVVGYEEHYQVSNAGQVKSKGFDYMGENNIRCVSYPKMLIWMRT